MATDQVETREDILLAIEELEQRRHIVQRYVDENVLPKEVEETLTNEIQDIQNATDSLLYVLDHCYKTTCIKCGRVMESELPFSESEFVCGGCFNAVRSEL